MQIELDGRRAYAYTGGRPFDPALPTLVFVHGAQSDHSVWILQSRYLAHHGWSVLAVDLPGHGRSEGPPLRTVAGMAAWVLKFASAAGATRAAIIGHSMGSLIAIEAAGRQPMPAGLSLLAIVPVATAFPMKVSDALLEAARTDEPRAFDMINGWSYTRGAVRPGCPGPGFSIYLQSRRLMERQPAGVLLNDFSACNDYADGLEAADGVRCPVHFVLGEKDQMTPPKAAAALRARLPGAGATVVPGGTHGLLNERADAVLAALRGFLEPLRDAAVAA